jgi:glycerophosphoryl diester phosphodiesterase
MMEACDTSRFLRSGSFRRNVVGEAAMHFGNHVSFALFGFWLVATSALAVDFYQPVRPPRPFQVMVHRGMSRQAPENTRPALARVAEDGFEWAEVDVRLTKDGQHVIFHDSQVDGKTDGHGAVKDLTLEQLQQLDAGKWFAPRFAGQKILTLKECLDLAKQKVNLYLDCKDIQPAKLVDEILAAGMADQVLVFANLDTLAQARQKSAGRVPIMPKWRPQFGLAPWIAKWHPDVVEIDAEAVTADVCRAFHDAHIKVQAKVLDLQDRPAVWDRVLEAGVDYLQTDLPEDIVAHRCWQKLSHRPVQISCHRGANRYAPENTLPAFKKAVQLGVDYAEFDVRPSHDVRYFILHDGTLNRTTDARGPIRALDAARIEQLDAGAKFGLPFRGTRIPTFDAMLDVLVGHTNLYVDAKDIPPEVLARVLTERKVLEQSVVYQSPSYLRKLKSLLPESRGLCPLSRANQIDTLVDTVKPYGFDVDWSILSKELIDHCHARGVKVFSDALGLHETIEQYRRAMDWGIDVIQTDYPLRVMRAVELRASAKN